MFTWVAGLQLRLKPFNSLLVLGGLSAAIEVLVSYPLPSILGLVLGVVLSYIFSKIGSTRAFAGTLLIWFIASFLALAMSLENFTAFSVAYLLTSLTYFSLLKELGPGLASTIFIFSYIPSVSLLEANNLGIPIYKYLPYMISPGSGSWNVLSPLIRIFLAISAGYLISSVVIKIEKINLLSAVVILAGFAYTFVTVLSLSETPKSLAPYVGFLLASIPIITFGIAIRAAKAW